MTPDVTNVAPRPSLKYKKCHGLRRCFILTGLLLLIVSIVSCASPIPGALASGHFQMCVCVGGCLRPQRSTLLVPRCLFLTASKYTSRMGCKRAPPQRAHAGPGQGLRGQSTPATPSSCGQLKQGPKLFPGQQRSRRLWVGTQALKESSSLGKDALPMQQLLSGEQLIQIENVSPGGFCLIMQCFLHA